MIKRIILALAFVLTPIGAISEGLVALAGVLPGQSELIEDEAGLVLKLSLTQAVPYRVFTLDQPRRLVLSFQQVDWAGFDPHEFNRTNMVSDVRVGLLRQGWSGMVLTLAQPLSVRQAGLQTTGSGSAMVELRMVPISDAEFTSQAGAPSGIVLGVQGKQPTQPKDNQPLVVALDPGHGGVDPGAEREGVKEADLMMTFARELKETLLRSGSFKVILTREADDFVPLETRVSLARRAGADVFISLHADAIVEGRASGATIYTLSETASDIASQKLAERHDRADLLAGVDLRHQDDVIAGVLMDMARQETAPRSELLAEALVTSLSETVGVHKRPHLRAGFSVLKAPDIPSVLLELGFLSSERDRQNLVDVAWRGRAAAGILDALSNWVLQDATNAQLRRK